MLANPIMVASGTFGYGVEYGEVVDVQRLGAICCKGTTLRPRAGNPPPRVTETPGGMLNSIGLQNPGVDAVIEKYGRSGRAGRCGHRQHRRRIDRRLRRGRAPARRRAGLAGIELNISCPNVGKGGLQFAIDRDAARAVTAAVRRATDLPLLVKLSPNVADVRPIAKAIEEAGADAITAINTLSGLAVSADRTRAFLGNIYGGLSGPAIKPVALRIVYEVGAGRLDPDRRHRRRDLARGRSRFHGLWRGGGPGRDGHLRRPGTAGPAWRRAAGGMPGARAFACAPLVGTALPKRAGAPSAKGAEYRP